MEAAPSPNEQHPSWRISRMEMAGSFGWHAVPREKWLEIREKLAHFEAKDWNEILIKSNKQNHSVAVSSLSEAARQRLEEIRLDDVDDLISLRLSAKERLWGIRDNAVLQVLWWDPEHQICPSLKKHT